MLTTSLATLEKRLETRLLDLDKLHRGRPHLPTAMARAEAGERIIRQEALASRVVEQ